MICPSSTTSRRSGYFAGRRRGGDGSGKMAAKGVWEGVHLRTQQQQQQQEEEQEEQEQKQEQALEPQQGTVISTLTTSWAGAGTAMKRLRGTAWCRLPQSWTAGCY